MDSFNFDKLVQKHLEDTNDGCDANAYVMDPDRVTEVLEKLAESEQVAKAEILKYKSLCLLGFRHGEMFSGVHRACAPNIQTQLEGTRAMALAPMQFVTLAALWTRGLDSLEKLFPIILLIDTDSLCHAHDP